MIGREALAALVLVIGVSLAPAAVADEPTRYYASWEIVPQGRDEAKEWVEPGGIVTSARLIPRQFYVVPDGVTAEGSQMLPPGTELVSPKASETIGCTVKPRRDGVSPQYQRGFICLIDSDHDGRFDGYFWGRSASSEFMIGPGKIPKTIAAVEPARFEARDVQSMSDSPRVYLQYFYFASLVNELEFQTCLVGRPNRSIGCFGNDWIRVKRARLPYEFEALGGRFRVEAKEDSRVRVTMLSPFAAQPFIVY